MVIIGQDPYHGPNQGMGLCFSVNRGIRVPPSLVNIFKEVGNGSMARLALAQSVRQACCGSAACRMFF